MDGMARMPKCIDQIITGNWLDVQEGLPAGCCHTCVTSPPYWGLRDYGIEPVDWPAVEFIPVAGLPPITIPAQSCPFGLEADPWSYVGHSVLVFRAVYRVLRDDGTLWLNLGDAYSHGNSGGAVDVRTDGRNTTPGDKVRGRMAGANTLSPGLKPKDLLGIPWMVAKALQADGWYLRSEIIWHKPNPMPESCRDRPTKGHEQIFLLSKRPKYFYDAEAIREEGEGYGRCEGFRSKRYENNRSFDNDADAPRSGAHTASYEGGRNKRTVWTVATAPFSEAHFATFPPKLIEPCIAAGSSEKGCCAECGAPWERVVEKERVRTRPGLDSKSYDRTTGEIVDDGIEKPWRDRAEIGNRDPGRHVTETTTTGWRPTCECGNDPIPCTVLDPFIGAGTTALVAAGLGRHYIGIEANAEYAEQARQRVHGPLFASKSQEANHDA